MRAVIAFVVPACVFGARIRISEDQERSVDENLQPNQFCGPYHRDHRNDDVKWSNGQIVMEAGVDWYRCRELCYEHSECTAFNHVVNAPWIKDGTTQHCYLKKGIYDSSQLNGDHKDWANVYIRCNRPQEYRPQPNYCGPHHRDHRNDDVKWDNGQIVSEEGASWSRCKEMCNEHFECSAFNHVQGAAWLPHGVTQKCYLKTGIYYASQLTGDYKDWANIYFKC